MLKAASGRSMNAFDEDVGERAKLDGMMVKLKLSWCGLKQC
jgi:hypothetical protein